MSITEHSYIINELSELPHAFLLNDISIRLWDENNDLAGICMSIDNDRRFICAISNETEEKTYIAKNTLYYRFARLNIRLAESKVYTISERDLLLELNNLRLEGKWISPPITYIEFGQSLGLIYHRSQQEDYVFPLAYVLSFLSQMNIKAAEEYLLSKNYYENDMPQFEDLILNQLSEVLRNLTSLQEYIIIRRQGILGQNHMTLGKIGQQLNKTRERIRQIEGKSWKRIWHPRLGTKFVPLLLIYLLNRRGSLIIINSKIQSEVMFILKCLNIPIGKFSGTYLLMIGDVYNDILSVNIWRDLFDQKSVLNHLSSKPTLPITEADLKEIANRITPILMKRLTKTQKVYLALKQIGRQAHFSEIVDMYMNLFPEEHTTEHSVHAALLHEKDGVVWIGSKGTFALEEWGFERPPISIHDAIAEIVKQKYEATGNPVRLNVIQTEIGKYRRFVRPNSIIIAAYCNSKLHNVYDDYFVPKDTYVESEADDSKLDQILKEFEQRMKGEAI